MLKETDETKKNTVTGIDAEFFDDDSLIRSADSATWLGEKTNQRKVSKTLLETDYSVVKRSFTIDSDAIQRISAYCNIGDISRTDWTDTYYLELESRRLVKKSSLGPFVRTSISLNGDVTDELDELSMDETDLKPIITISNSVRAMVIDDCLATVYFQTDSLSQGVCTLEKICLSPDRLCDALSTIERLSEKLGLTSLPNIFLTETNNEL